MVGSKGFSRVWSSALLKVLRLSCNLRRKMVVVLCTVARAAHARHAPSTSTGKITGVQEH